MVIQHSHIPDKGIGVCKVAQQLSLVPSDAVKPLFHKLFPNTPTVISLSMLDVVSVEMRYDCFLRSLDIYRSFPHLQMAEVLMDVSLHGNISDS